MCGILAVYGKASKELAIESAKRLFHRGGDERGVLEVGKAILCHERLSIVDVSGGRQPIPGCHGAHVIHNGEIYNHEKLWSERLKDKKHKRHTRSDSEVIVHMYESYGDEFLDELDGIFALVVTDGDKFLAARDPIGVKPLFYGQDKFGNWWFSSEYKAIWDQCIEFKEFPPGHYFTPEKGFVPYYLPEWREEQFLPKEDGSKLRELLEQSVEKRLMADVPIGVFLSGGLDSSLIASILVRKLKEKGGPYAVQSFSVGFNENSSDLKAAKEVADFIGTKHHQVVLKVEDGIRKLDEIIYHLETYDVTTIRAGTPMYLLSSYIKQQGIKVMLSGEGADEIFGGYLYFHNAPTTEDFHQECIRRIGLLFSADVLRVDRTTMAHAIEGRVPFLDKKFLAYAMSILPSIKQAKGKMEKTILRQAFDDQNRPYLPKSILWRQKEQFSDGVGYNWIDGLKEWTQSQVTDDEMKKASITFPFNTPETKEAYYYRKVYEKFYPNEHARRAVYRWIPKWQTSTDPSGRANANHADAYQKDKKTLP